MDPIDNPYAAPALADASVEMVGAGPGHQQLQTVAAGLKVLYVGLCLSVVSFVLMIIITLTTSLVDTARLLSGFTVYFVAILLAVGQAMCISVPPETKARAFAIAAFSCQILGLLSGLASTRFAPLAGNLPSTLLFVVFLRRVATFLDRADLVRQTRNWFMALGVTIASTIAALAYAEVLFIVVAFAIIFVFIQYANLINYVRTAIVLPTRRMTI